jgi:hypothetical protein
MSSEKGKENIETEGNISFINKNYVDKNSKRGTVKGVKLLLSFFFA